MSLYSLVFIGMTTVGSLYTGSLSEYSGAGTTFIVSAIIGMVSCVVLYFFGRKSSVKF